MESNKIDINEIVKITQMPEIFSQLEQIGLYIDEKLDGVNEMVCSEENKKEVKEKRAEINNTLKVLEDKRKEIKKKLEEPYKTFEEKYKLECKDKLEEASNILGEKITTIENEQKQTKQQMLQDFFKQYQEYYHLENIVDFEDVGLNITLSASEKSLKDEIIEFCKNKAADINLIIQEEDSEEIMVEYMKNGLDYVKAKATILDRHNTIEKLKEQKEQQEEVLKQEQSVVQNVETLVSMPKKVVEKEETFEVTFKVKTTKKKLILLKQFMETEEIEYND